jgi:hypothetical protein
MPDALLLGRETYESFAQIWPTRQGKMADKISSVPKYVASRTLKEPLQWNATLIKGDVAEEIRKLKQEPGKSLLQYGVGELTHTIEMPDGPLPKSLEQRIYDPWIGLGVYMLVTLVLGLVYLMTAKPALGGSLLVMGVAVILGLVVSLPGWRIAGRGIEKRQENIETARRSSR